MRVGRPPALRAVVGPPAPPDTLSGRSAHRSRYLRIVTLTLPVPSALATRPK